MTTPTPLLQALLQDGHFYRRRKGQTIDLYQTKGTVSLIRDGYIKRYLISKEGALGTQSIYGPGYFFPLTAAFVALLDQHIYHGDETYFYEAITDVQIYSIKGDVLTAAAEANPLLYKEVLYEAGRRLQSNIQNLENISLKSAYLRLAHQLVFLAAQFGEVSPRGYELNLPLTHQDLADNLNLNRETISRAFGKLRQHGLIELDSHIIIPDLEKLKAIYQ